MNLKSREKGTLEDGTAYSIEENKKLIINGKTWLEGTREEIDNYIKRLNEE